ncbi:LysR family transcriptional regulator [Kribbella sp. HUAS MG21]|uniref:LysR family transcriptional regulator n=1 Tax=Kribbella sp. HUAS MG21 TaxID=3160966 RepID=A0AAU7THJ7_9ACTN
MLDVEKLATLRAVVRHGSFSSAAQALHLTQPAVSRQVSSLERCVGAQLVVRTHRGVRATEAGELLLRHTDAILNRLALAEWEVGQLAGLRGSTIRLGSFFSALVHLSSELAFLLEERHPGLTIADDLVNREEALTKLVRGALDVALVFEHAQEPAGPTENVDIVTLFDDPLTVLLPARHWLADRPAVQLSDLGNETWIRAHTGSAARMIDRLLTLTDADPSIRLAGNGDEPIEAQALVAAGAGIAFAHRLNVVLEPDQLAIKPLRGLQNEHRHIQAACRTGERTPTVAATMTALTEIGHHHGSLNDDPPKTRNPQSPANPIGGASAEFSGKPPRSHAP